MLCVVLLAAICIGWSNDCAGQLTTAPIAELVELAESTRGSIGDRPLPSIETAAADVVASSAAVTAYLAPKTTPENLAAWVRYIGSDRLVKAIESDASPDEVTELARRVQHRLIGDREGLELPVMTALRRDAERLADSARFANADNAIRMVEQTLDALTRRLRQWKPVPTPDDAAALGLLLDFLDQSGQATELVTAVRERFSYANAVVTIDADAISQAIQRDVDRSRTICDCILGTRVVGTGQMTGKVSGRLIPDDQHVRIELILNGEFHSQTVGYNGPVRLPTVGYGKAESVRTVRFDEAGVVLSPPSTSGSVSSTITSIQHPLKLVRRIARKQIAQRKPKAERIAGERFRDQVSQEFAAQTSEAINAAELASRLTTFKQRSGVKLARLNVDPPQRNFSSTTSRVVVEVAQTSGCQLAASIPPPDLADTGMRTDKDFRFDAAIQLHESMVDNVASRIVAGRTVTSAEIDRLIGDIGLPVTGRTTDQDRFEIDFSNVRPIICELREQTVRIGIRGNRFSQGDRELRRAVEITATYLPERRSDGAVVLVRRGDVAVDFPGTRRLSVQQVAIRTSIQKLFADRFPAKLLDRPIVMLDTVQIASLRGKSYSPTLIDSRDGWISIAIR